MRIDVCVVLALAAVAAVSLASAATKKSVDQLQVGVKKRPSTCKTRTQIGDVISVHYTGVFHDSGEEFDSSLTRGDPFVFTLGQGQVIRGWERGLLGMCIGEIRKLVVPPDLGYGAYGAPPKIPGGATLRFEIELLNIERNGHSEL